VALKTLDVTFVMLASAILSHVALPTAAVIAPATATPTTSATASTLLWLAPPGHFSSYLFLPSLPLSLHQQHLANV
jgi:hypothetical protein